MGDTVDSDDTIDTVETVETTFQLFSFTRPSQPVRSVTLLHHLARCATSHFTRVSGLPAGPIRLGETPDSVVPVDRVCDLCETPRRSSACRAFADSMLSAMHSDDEPVWRRCPYQRWCGFVPLHSCVEELACQVIGASTTTERSFGNHIGMLNDISKRLVLDEMNELRGKLEGGNGASHDQAPKSKEVGPGAGTRHHVWNAVAYAHEHLGNKQLNVRYVARALGLNDTYLAHLFSTLLGMRLRRFINDRRVDLARILLCRTDWQVKQVAFATGHDSPQWFTHLFRVHTGMSPERYRQSHRIPG